MTRKRIVATIVALTSLLVAPPGRGVARAQLTTLTCPLFHAKLDAAVHDRIHNAPATTRIQTIVRTPLGGLDAVVNVVPLLGARIDAVHTGISALTLDIAVGSLATLASLSGVMSISLDAPLTESRSLAPATCSPPAPRRMAPADRSPISARRSGSTTAGRARVSASR